MPSEVLYGYQDAEFAPEFPAIGTVRGGIFYPRYRVETMVEPAKKRFLRRRTWRLHVRYWDPENNKHAHHYMVFASQQDANNAEQIIKFTIQTINEQYQEEQRAR